MPEYVDQAKLTARFEQALIYATRLHARQVRKASQVPYIVHLLSTAALVVEDGGDEDEAIAALLHDAIEDQGGDEIRQEIRCRFGDRVRAIVDGCTDADVQPKPPWRERKERFLASLVHASTEVRRVTAADKLHNVRSILLEFREHGDAIWPRFNGGKKGTLWYYRAVVRALQTVEAREETRTQLVGELDRAVTELETLIRS
ncbi:MAG TPA: HD domain-containing protein [Chloroflexi bacterium]|nr:HD domain-containing protein [Chloroflexota bacterium]